MASSIPPKQIVNQLWRTGPYAQFIRRSRTWQLLPGLVDQSQKICRSSQKPLQYLHCSSPNIITLLLFSTANWLLHKNLLLKLEIININLSSYKKIRCAVYPDLYQHQYAKKLKKCIVGNLDIFISGAIQC